MLEPRRHTFRSLSAHGFHEVVYREWGNLESPRVVVCVHGLTRNGRDFDALAAALADRFRVLCPDMPGRGESEWLPDPNDYVFPTYLTSLTALLAHAHVDHVAWVGTSMGGLLGMILAAQRGSPVTRLVINDIGPVIEQAALTRIAGYVGMDPPFESFAALETHIREVSASFGPLTDAQWRHLALTTSRQTDDGRWRLKYDPGIAIPFRSTAATGGDLWAIWDAIHCPALLLRGAESDLLSKATAEAMRTRGPQPRLIEFTGIGHAPMLLSPDQIGPVIAFLEEH
jgi:pimeloyl-ACP methyl ester carboxylesterase